LFADPTRARIVAALADGLGVAVTQSLLQREALIRVDGAAEVGRIETVAGWLRPLPPQRAVALTPSGQQALQARLGLAPDGYAVRA
jgi:hypothetical protein